jgi:hypothetical protein
MDGNRRGAIAAQADDDDQRIDDGRAPTLPRPIRCAVRPTATLSLQLPNMSATRNGPRHGAAIPLCACPES